MDSGTPFFVSRIKQSAFYLRFKAWQNISVTIVSDAISRSVTYGNGNFTVNKINDEIQCIKGPPTNVIRTQYKLHWIE